MDQELIALLLENVQYQLRHPNYARTLEVRDFSMMVTTDTGQDKEVNRYRRFEHEDQKEQRNRLYNSFTGSIISSLRKNWKRMARVEGVRQTFVPESDEINALKDSLYNFFPGESFEDWLNRMMEHWQVTDPNTWIVFERNDERNEEGQIVLTRLWPFVVPSVDALNWGTRYGILKWFICRTSEIEMYAENGQVKNRVLETYFLYAPGRIIRLREIGQKTIQEQGEEVTAIDVYPTDNTQNKYDIPVYTGGKKTRNFYLKVIDNGTKEVPAIIAGAYMDEATGHETRVPWFQPGKGLLQDMIKLKSSLDVCLTVHTYPRRWEFVKPCKFSDPERGECVHGYLNDIRDDGHRCPSCGGSGIAANFTTEQEVLQLVMPDSPELILELSKLAFTEPIDVTLPELLQKLLDRREIQFVQAIFSSDNHQKPDGGGAMTAFEVAKINEGVHDALTTYGKQYSKIVELAYRVGAQYREIRLDSVDHSFPEDLQIEVLDELLDRFKNAKDSGVGYEVLTSIRRRIHQKLFEGDPYAQKRIATRYYWMPWDDQSPESIAMIIAGRSPMDDQVILYQNFKAIFQEIEDENPEFFRMERKKQKEIITEKVETYKETIELIDEPTPPEPALFPPAGQPIDNPNDNPEPQPAT